MVTLFLDISLPSLFYFDVKMCNFMYYGGRNEATKVFYSLSLSLNMVLRNSIRGGFAYIRQSTELIWNKVDLRLNKYITRIHFLSDVFAAVAVLSF